MREILFKAKRISNGEWVEGYYQENPKGYVHIQNSSMDCFPVIPETVCQYTGLTDKNGRKIWENDVVKITYKDNYYEIGWIRYSNVSVRYRFIVQTESYSFDDLNDIEVIGNIFDNPELLERGE